jgi:predicted permease
LSRSEHITLVGDFEEIFDDIVRRHGRLRAAFWYWGQLFKSAPAYLFDTLFWSLHMFKNYLKAAWRNIRRNPGYSLINLTGLAIGLACCLFIGLWVLDELSYDRFHEDASRLYRVEFDQNYSGKSFHVTVTPYPLARALKAEVAEIEQASRFTRLGDLLVRQGEKTLYEAGAVAADPAFLDMFSFPLIRGDKRTALNDPQSLILSEELARKYFDGEDPLGKILSVNIRREFRVTGVMKNIPANSSLQFDMLMSFKLLESIGNAPDDWDSNNIPTFVKLRGEASPAQTAAKVRDVVGRHGNVEDLTYSLMPLARIHLYSHYGFDRTPRASQYVYIFSVVALFVLLIACINFMNLSTARSAKRAKEVGVRKVVGAVKRDIIRQFYSESLLFTLLALSIALVLVIVLLPFFNSITGKTISLQSINTPQLLAVVLVAALFTGWIAGSYPALFLGSFQPIRTLCGKLRSGPKSTGFRRIMVVIQFSLSIALIIGTGVVYSQLNFIQDQKLGFEKDHLIYIPLRGIDRGLYSRLKTKLEGISPTYRVSAARHRPSAIYSNTSGADWDGKDPELDVSTYMTWVDYDYFATTGIEFVEGRGFSIEFPTDRESAYIINEETVKMMGLERALGQRFALGEREGSIIGVVKNFHFDSLKRAVEPLAIMLQPENISYILIRIPAGNVPASLSHIEKIWKQEIPDYPFESRFLNDDFDLLYRSEARMGDILKYFASLAVFIACLGLLGLASFAAEQRTKEIGIRKVLGASSSQIGYLIYREFMLLLLISIMMAWPAAYLIMRNWLQDFAYRTGISPFIFLLAALAAILSAFITVGFQAFKASITDPVRALRYE